MLPGILKPTKLSSCFNDPKLFPCAFLMQLLTLLVFNMLQVYFTEILESILLNVVMLILYAQICSATFPKKVLVYFEPPNQPSFFSTEINPEFIKQSVPLEPMSHELTHLHFDPSNQSECPNDFVPNVENLTCLTNNFLQNLSSGSKLISKIPTQCDTVSSATRVTLIAPCVDDDMPQHSPQSGCPTTVVTPITEQLLSSLKETSEAPFSCAQPEMTPHTFQMFSKELQDALIIQDEKLKEIEDELQNYGIMLLEFSTHLVVTQLPNPEILPSVSPDDVEQNSALPAEDSSLLAQPVTLQQGVAHEPVIPNRSSLKLHELTSLSSVITKYDGDSSKYQQFKHRFTTVVNSMDLTDPDKGLLLYISLEDEVLQYLGSITENGCINYQMLWSELDQEFDPPQHGIYSHIASLFTINSMPQCDSLDQLVEFYKFVRLHYISLKKLGAEHEVEGLKLQLLSKLPNAARDKVSSLITNAEGKPVVPSILDILKEEISLMSLQELATSLSGDVSAQGEQHVEPMEKDICTHQAPPKSILKPTPLMSQSKLFNCVFCRTNTHHSNNCNRYRTPDEYRRFLFHHRLCYNCCDYGHKSSGCPQSKKCSLCYDPRKHSPVLCSCYHSHHNYRGTEKY